MEVYKYIHEKANVGTADSILGKLESLSEFVEASGIATTLTVATEEFDKKSEN